MTTIFFAGYKTCIFTVYFSFLPTSFINIDQVGIVQSKWVVLNQKRCKGPAHYILTNHQNWSKTNQLNTLLFQRVTDRVFGISRKMGLKQVEQQGFSSFFGIINITLRHHTWKIIKYAKILANKGLVQLAISPAHGTFPKYKT